MFHFLLRFRILYMYTIYYDHIVTHNCLLSSLPSSESSYHQLVFLLYAYGFKSSSSHYHRQGIIYWITDKLPLPRCYPQFVTTHKGKLFFSNGVSLIYKSYLSAGHLPSSICPTQMNSKVFWKAFHLIMLCQNFYFFF